MRLDIKFANLYFFGKPIFSFQRTFSGKDIISVSYISANLLEKSCLLHVRDQILSLSGFISSRNQGTFLIDSFFGADVFNAPSPIRAEIIESQTILFWIDFLDQPIL